MIYVVKCRETGLFYHGFSDGWHIWVHSASAATHYAVPGIYGAVADLQSWGYNVIARVDTNEVNYG